MMFSDLTTALAQATGTDIFAGGFALGLLGVALGLARVLGLRGWHWGVRRMTVTLTLDNRTQAYRHLYGWLDATGVLAHVRQLRVADIAGDEVYGPAPGLYWFWWKGRLGLLTRFVSDDKKTGGGYSARPLETVKLTLVCGRLATLRGWIADGATHLENAARTGPALYVLNGDYWQAMGQIKGRPLATVIADDDRVERLADDLRRFRSRGDWYADRGIPWRRGYLLFGPPGTGKSSAIRALATELGMDIATLDVGRSGLTDDALREALMTAPRNALVAIEDIDAVFTQRDVASKAGVSFSGLLNAIDGVATQEGRALVMTTNHLERLDPALIRPGRADVHLELGLVGAGAAAQLFARFFPDDAARAVAFARAIGTQRFSPAELQGWLLANADNAGEASGAQGLIEKVALMAAE
jgi:mitochondrial chaperone BCS1